MGDKSEPSAQYNHLNSQLIAFSRGYFIKFVKCIDEYSGAELIMSADMVMPKFGR